MKSRILGKRARRVEEIRFAFSEDEKRVAYNVNSLSFGLLLDYLREVLRLVVDSGCWTVWQRLEESEFFVGSFERKRDQSASVEFVKDLEGLEAYPAVVKTFSAPKALASWLAATPTPPVSPQQENGRRSEIVTTRRQRARIVVRTSSSMDQSRLSLLKVSNEKKRLES